MVQAENRSTIFAVSARSAARPASPWELTVSVVKSVVPANETSPCQRSGVAVSHTAVRVNETLSRFDGTGSRSPDLTSWPPMNLVELIMRLTVKGTRDRPRCLLPRSAGWVGASHLQRCTDGAFTFGDGRLLVGSSMRDGLLPAAERPAPSRVVHQRGTVTHAIRSRRAEPGAP